MTAHCIVWHADSYLTSRPKHQKSCLNTGRFILNLWLTAQQNYNTITKEEKDPECSHAIKNMYNEATKQLINSLHILNLTEKH